MLTGRLKSSLSDQQSPLMRVERRTAPKKSIDRIRIDKTRKFSSKGSSSPFRNLSNASPQLKTDKSKEESDDRSNRMMKLKQGDKRLFLGKLKTESSQDKLKFRKINQGQSPAIRRIIDSKRLIKFGKAK